MVRGAVSGPIQSVAMAEHLAMVRAVESSRPPVEVVIDCWAAVLNHRHLARAIKPGQPFCDLWARVQAQVASWQPGGLVITWQAAHLSMEQALAGGFLLENWYDNKEVDEQG